MSIQVDSSPVHASSAEVESAGLLPLNEPKKTWLDRLLEMDVLPDVALRLGMRRLIGSRLRERRAAGSAAKEKLIEELRTAPLAIATDRANEQHYEVSAAFYELVLGKHLKYSCAYWDGDQAFDADNLDAAELAMLERYAERARLANGQRILELGCGWGSMTLFMAERFPGARITAISNSASQREFIMGQAAARGLNNVDVKTVDINDFSTGLQFDRIVSIEMFEHVRNHGRLFERLAEWLLPDGELFVHIFCHRDQAYTFEDEGAGDWMARYFFTGGIMPSADLLPQVAGSLKLDEQWWLNGVHYEKTSEAWLARMDREADKVLAVFAPTYGTEAERFFIYWRIFFMACAELFGYRGGEEWGVAHYRFKK